MQFTTDAFELVTVRVFRFFSRYQWKRLKTFNGLYRTIYIDPHYGLILGNRLHL